MEPRSKTEMRMQRLINAQAKLIEAQDKMLIVYKTQNFFRGPAAADRLSEARERTEKAKTALADVASAISM